MFCLPRNNSMLFGYKNVIKINEFIALHVQNVHKTKDILKTINEVII